MQTDIVIDDSRWNCINLNSMAKEIMKKTFDLKNVDGKNHYVSILACSNSKIKYLNKKFRNKNFATNVLSWSTKETKNFYKHSEKNIFLGNIAISFDQCAKEALDYNKTFYNYIMHMLTHSLLHLFGFDHNNEKNTVEMESLEIRILKELNISNPYIIE